MSSADGYILIVQNTKQGLKVYVYPKTREELQKIWDFLKGRQTELSRQPQYGA